LICLVQPSEGLVFIAQTDIDDGEQVWTDVLTLRHFAQLGERLLRLIALAGERISVSERCDEKWMAFGLSYSFLKCLNRLRVHLLLLVCLSKVRVAVDETRFQVNRLLVLGDRFVVDILKFTNILLAPDMMIVFGIVQREVDDKLVADLLRKPISMK
jgi:hypothetical protein